MFLKIKKGFSKLLNAAENVMFPNNYCPFCENESLNGNVCENCSKHFIKPNFCTKCGEHISDSTALCIECKNSRRYFTKSFSVVEYDSETSRALLKLKTNGAKYLAKDFAKLLYNKFLEIGISVDWVCSVPTTKEKLKKRGYNHAAEIAKEFCRLANLPYEELLIKTRETREQKQLGKADRLKNLLGTFAVTDKWLVKGRNILVIDDIFTTGSTLSACAKELTNARAENVYCLTVAKSPIKSEYSLK